MLLSTKLIPPHPSEIVIQRPRLFKQLEQAASGRLTVVMAPAGYGKTTLVANWLQTPVKNRLQSTWVLLDEYDDEPVRFLRYFITALQQLTPNIGESLEESLQSNLTTLATHDIENVFTVLINELAASGEQILLVLDDFHLITNQQIVDGIRFWIEHAPASVHTILTCREEPALPLARWRVRRQGAEITSSDLCFTQSEATTFIRETLRLDLSDEDIARLTARTEGWIAGLQLAALSLQASDDPADLLDGFTGSERHVMDYLIEEVLHKQSSDLHDFLLQTSILKRLSPTLCDSIIGTNNSIEILEEMEKRNLFLVPFDNQREWYRYHPLFAESLQARLKRTRRFDLLALHRRAYEWFDEHGMIDEAVEHALHAEMFDQAAALIDRISQSMLWQEGRARTHMRWCKQLPTDSLFSRPTLPISLGWAHLLSGRYAELADLIEMIRDAQSSGQCDFETDSQIRNELAVFEAEVAVNFGQIQEVMQILDQFDPAVDLPNPATQAIAQQLVGYAHRLNGDISEAKTFLQKAVHISDERKQKYIWIFSHNDLIETHLIAGELAEAEATCHKVLQRYQSESSDYFHILLARIYFLGNRLTDAVNTMQLALSSTDQSGWMSYYARMTQIEIEYLLGNWTTVQSIIEDPNFLETRHFGPRRRALVSTSVARHYLLHGDVDKALPWIQIHQDEADLIPRYQRHRMDVTYARYLVRTKPTTSLPMLQELGENAARHNWRESLIEINILIALLHYDMSDGEAALVALHDALELAKPEGILAPFLIEGPSISPLLQAASKQSTHREFVGKLQASFLPVVAPASQPLVEPLTKRELDVLKMIAEGLSNPEIAERLILATGTVAKHTNNIFGKLAVRNRTEATQKGLALGLI